MPVRVFLEYIKQPTFQSKTYYLAADCNVTVASGLCSLRGRCGPCPYGVKKKRQTKTKKRQTASWLFVVVFNLFENAIVN